MIDQIEEMISAWQRNDTDQAPTLPPKMPVVIVSMAKDYSPSGREYGRQVLEQLEMILPEDGEEHCFGLRIMSDLTIVIIPPNHERPRYCGVGRQGAQERSCRCSKDAGYA